jgi:hypothetical protein
MGRPWWQRTCRVYQANNFETDPAECDGARIADEAVRLDCNAVIVDAGGGISTFYPTKIPHLAGNPYLEEGRDFFGEMVQACQARGLRVFARNDWGHLPESVAREHPEWAIRDGDGVPGFRHGMSWTCPTGPLYREIAVEGFREQMDAYDIDGIYINGLGGRCRCARCRRMFRDETGMEIPDAEDWDDAAWRAYVAWGYRVVDDLARTQYQGLIATHPDKLYFIDAADFQSPGWIRGKAQDLAGQAAGESIVSTEAFNDVAEPAPRMLASTVSRLVRTLAERHAKPGWVFVSSFPGHSWPNLNQPTEEFRSYAATCYLNGTSVVVPFYGHLDNDDTRLLSPCRDVFGFAREHADLLDEMAPVAPVAVVWSRPTMDYYAREDMQERAVRRLFGTSRALLESHIPYTIIDSSQLDDAGLAGVEVLVLPNVACLSDRQCGAIDRFVEGGGRLVASFETSRYDELGVRREGFGLSCLPVSTDGHIAHADSPWRSSRTHSYLRIVRGDHPLAEGFGDTPILPLKGAWLGVRVTDPGASEPLAAIPPHDAQPPEIGWVRPTIDDPMAVVSSDGRVVYFAHQPFQMHGLYELPDTRRLIARAVRSAWAPPIEVDAPPTVEVTLSRAGERTLVGLVNHTAALVRSEAPIPAGPVTVRLPGNPLASARPLRGSRCHLVDDGRVLRVECVETFELIELG